MAQSSVAFTLKNQCRRAPHAYIRNYLYNYLSIVVYPT